MCWWKDFLSKLSEVDKDSILKDLENRYNIKITLHQLEVLIDLYVKPDIFPKWYHLKKKKELRKFKLIKYTGFKWILTEYGEDITIYIMNALYVNFYLEDIYWRPRRLIDEDYL